MPGLPAGRAASHEDLVQALGHVKSNLGPNLTGLEVKGLVTIARTLFNAPQLCLNRSR